MKIVILDGRLGKSQQRFDSYINELKSLLEQAGHTAEHFVVKDLDLHHCIGCWDCWVKTPGQCVFDDASRAINRAIIKADFLLFATPLVMGYATYELKRKMDRIIPLIHPYITVVENESHHRARYEKYPLVGLLVQPGATDTEEDVFITSEMFARTALNFKSRLAFSVTMEEEPADLAARFEKVEAQHYSFNREIPQRERDKVGPLDKIAIFNGSPRGKKGNTPILLDQFAQGFSSIKGRSVETYHLFKTKNIDVFTEAFEQAESVLIGFPLYTDAMPGIVKQFIDALEPLTQRDSNPPIAFLVQSGFGENHHSRYVQRYLESLAARLHSPYLGTMVRGGCEEVRMMPENMNRKTFDALHTIGVEMAENGKFNQVSLDAFGNREKYAGIQLPFFKLMTRMPFMNWYWNSQLKKNNAYAKRFNKPYQETV